MRCLRSSPPSPSPLRQNADGNRGGKKKKGKEKAVIIAKVFRERVGAEGFHGSIERNNGRCNDSQCLWAAAAGGPAQYKGIYHVLHIYYGGGGRARERARALSSSQQRARCKIHTRAHIALGKEREREGLRFAFPPTKKRERKRDEIEKPWYTGLNERSLLQLWF